MFIAEIRVGDEVFAASLIWLKAIGKTVEGGNWHVLRDRAIQGSISDQSADNEIYRAKAFINGYSPKSEASLDVHLNETVEIMRIIRHMEVFQACEG